MFSLFYGLCVNKPMFLLIAKKTVIKHQEGRFIWVLGDEVKIVLNNV